VKKKKPIYDGLSQKLYFKPIALIPESEKNICRSFFGESLLVLTLPHSWKSQQDTLEKIRKALREKSRKESIFKLQEKSVFDIHALLNSYLENAYFLTGHPPCKIALLLLGSNSRYDRLPYSDLEIALIYGYDASVENNTNRKHAIYHYLASLIALLEIQIVYLGESHSEKQGFRLDKSTSLRCRVYLRSEVQNIIEKGLREKERHDSTLFCITYCCFKTSFD